MPRRPTAGSGQAAFILGGRNPRLNFHCCGGVKRGRNQPPLHVAPTSRAPVLSHVPPPCEEGPLARTAPLTAVLAAHTPAKFNHV